MDRLNQLGIAHGGIVDAGYGSGWSFRDPDGIALEFFAPRGDQRDCRAWRACGQNGKPAKKVPPTAMTVIAASTLLRPSDAQ
jgi:hypothetical protein